MGGGLKKGVSGGTSASGKALKKVSRDSAMCRDRSVIGLLWPEQVVFEVNWRRIVKSVRQGRVSTLDPVTIESPERF